MGGGGRGGGGQGGGTHISVCVSDWGQDPCPPKLEPCLFDRVLKQLLTTLFSILAS